jgi:hypothetical protein
MEIVLLQLWGKKKTHRKEVKLLSVLKVLRGRC